MSAMPGRWAEPKIGLQVSDCGNNIIVHACMPGISEGSVQIMVDGNLFTIRMESPVTSESNSDASFRSFQAVPVPAHLILTRSITLPASVEATAECASCADGSIDITLRKSAMVQAGSTSQMVQAGAR